MEPDRQQNEMCACVCVWELEREQFLPDKLSVADFDSSKVLSGCGGGERGDQPIHLLHQYSFQFKT